VTSSACRQPHTPAGEEGTPPTSKFIESNLAEYWLSLGDGPRGEIHKSGVISWAYSGGRFFNRVVSAQLGDADVDSQIDLIIDTFRRRRAAITWLTGPSTQPENIGEYLEAHGFSRYEDWKGMAHTLDSLDHRSLTVPSGFKVVQVATPETCKDWLRVVGRSFGLPISAYRILRHHVFTHIGSDSPIWRHNLAYLNDAPVSAVTLFINQGVAGIYLVSTIPEARGKGLGTHMTSLALRQAKELGCELVVLHATEQGQRMYEKLGFRAHCNIGVYRLAAPHPMWKRLAATSLRRVRQRLVTSRRRRARLTMGRNVPDARRAQGDPAIQSHS
jgi:GNAT superfamily N-acetyltransferase